jgi:hypothetical protein
MQRKGQVLHVVLSALYCYLFVVKSVSESGTLCAGVGHLLRGRFSSKGAVDQSKGYHSYPSKLCARFMHSFVSRTQVQYPIPSW